MDTEEVFRDLKLLWTIYLFLYTLWRVSFFIPREVVQWMIHTDRAVIDTSFLMQWIAWSIPASFSKMKQPRCDKRYLYRAGPPMGLVQGLLPRPLAKAWEQICHLCRAPRKCLVLPRALKTWHGVSHQPFLSGPWIWHCISSWGSTEQDPEGSLPFE